MAEREQGAAGGGEHAAGDAKRGGDAAAAPAVEGVESGGGGAGGALQRTIEHHRNDPAALATELKALPAWQHRQAHMTLVRTLGPERAAAVSEQAFGRDRFARRPDKPAALPSQKKEKEADERKQAQQKEQLARAQADDKKGATGDGAAAGGQGATADPVGAALAKSLGPEAAKVDIQRGGNPGGTGGAAVGAVAYVGGKGGASPSLELIGHEVAHVLQQRRGGGGGPLTPERRAELEQEAARAGEAVASGGSFAVTGAAPASAALYDSTWGRFENACNAHDAAAIRTALHELTPADQVHGAGARPVLVEMVRAIGPSEGPRALGDTFHLTFAPGLRVLLDAAQASDDAIPNWFGVVHQDWNAGVEQMRATPGVSREAVLTVLAMPASTPTRLRTLANSGATVGWLRGLFAPQYATDVLHALAGTPLLFDAFTYAPELREWMCSDVNRLNAEINRQGDQRDLWIGALVSGNKIDLLRQLVVLNGAGWSDPLCGFAQRANAGQRAAVASNQALLLTCALMLGARAREFFAALRLTLMDGAVALVMSAHPPDEVVGWINDKRFTVDDQRGAVSDPRFPIVWAWFGGRYVDEALPLLAADPTRMVDAYAASPVFKNWINSNHAKFESVVVEHSADKLKSWIQPLIDVSEAKYILDKAAAQPQRWKDALVQSGAYTPFMNAPPKQDAIPPGSTTEQGFWSLYAVAPDLTARKAAFSKLYKVPLSDSGTVTINSPAPIKVMFVWQNMPVDATATPAREASTTKTVEYSGDWKMSLPTRAASDAQFDQIMGQFKMIPRAHVNTVSQLVLSGLNSYTTSYKLNTMKDTATGKMLPVPGAAWASFAPTPMTTSYYFSGVDTVVLNTDKFANGQTAFPEAVRLGATTDAHKIVVPGAAGGDPKASKALTLLQNHATHEVGHSVGAKPFKYKDASGALQAGEAGDFFTKTWADWRAETRAAVLGAYWAPTGPATAPAGAKNWVAPADAAKFLLDALVAGNPAGVAFQPPVTNLAHGTVWTSAAAWNAISRQYAGQALVNYVAKTVAIGFNTYTMLNFDPPSGGRVYMYAGTDGQFVSYKRQVWDDRGKLSWYGLSHYREMFAEMYTNRFGAHRDTPTGTQAFFDNLEKAEEFGAVAQPEVITSTTNVLVTAGTSVTDAFKGVVAAEVAKMVKGWP